MAYIDGDKLIQELSTMYKEPTSTEDFMTIGYDKAIADVVVTAHRQPTADVVEVVRCRDCKHRNGSACDYSAVWVRENGFCQWGERKETEDG